MEKKTILIIEDEDICSQLVKIVIDSKENMDLLIAADGEEGIRMAMAKKPDLILLDIMLPKVDGYEVIRTLRSDPSAAEIPIVVLSARAGKEGEQKALDLGCQEFIAKPFKLYQIGDVIERYLQ